MMLSALALSLAIGHAKPSLDEKVTFTNPGLAVPQLIQELSKAAHVPLFAPKAFQSDVLAIRVKDATLSELLAKIGDLTAAEWQPKGDGFELVRSRKKQMAEEKAEYDREVAMFQTAIDKQKQALAKLEPWTEKSATTLANLLNDAQRSQPTDGRFDNGAWQRMQAMDAKAPGGRALTRILAALDAKQLASLPADYKIVFSDQPTAMQRRLPKEVIPGLQQLVAEQNIWSDVASKVFGDPQGGLFSNAIWMKRPFDGQRGKVLLMISKSSGARQNVGANIEIAASDRKGTIVVRGNHYLNTGATGNYKPPLPQPNEKPLPLSPLGEAAKGIMERGPTNGGERKLPKEVVDLLLDPEHHEPLALATGDMLVKIAEAREENLVAQISDELFIMGVFAGAQKMTPSMALKTIEMGSMVSEKGGWLTISPIGPATARALRMDRAIVGRFVRETAKDGRANLEEQATYAMGTTGELYNTLGFFITMVLSQSQQTEYFDPAMLRLYGLLDPNQRQALFRGTRLSLGGLTSTQFEIVNKMVFGTNPNLQAKQQPKGALPDSAWEAFYNGIGREPTELFPNGIPRESTVVLRIQSDAVMISPPYEAPGGGMYGTRSLGPDEVAQNLYARERPGIFPWIDGDTGWDQRKFWFGNRRVLDFTFDFGELALMSKQLQDTKFQSGDAVPYSQIPSEFRDSVQKRLEELRKQYAKVKPGDLGGSRSTVQRPPPPR
jgi:hypothetical protein